MGQPPEVKSRAPTMGLNQEASLTLAAHHAIRGFPKEIIAYIEDMQEGLVNGLGPEIPRRNPPSLENSVGVFYDILGFLPAERKRDLGERMETSENPKLEPILFLQEIKDILLINPINPNKTDPLTRSIADDFLDAVILYGNRQMSQEPMCKFTIHKTIDDLG